MQPPVNCPQGYLGQHGRHHQMNIDETQPFSHELVIFNELNYFLIICLDRHRKLLKEREYFRSVLKVSAGELTNDKRMTDYVTLIQ